MGSSNAISAKAKAMYAKRLTDDDYSSLLKKTSVSEVASYLKNETDYGYLLADVKEGSIHRGELESILKRDLYYKEVKLSNYAPSKEKGFYQTILKQLEIDNILERIKIVSSSLYEEISESDNDVRYREFCFNQEKLWKAKSFDEILDVIQKTPYYSIIQKYQPKNHENVDFVHLEKDLRHYYYECMTNNIDRFLKGKDKKDAMQIYLTSIELEIVTKVYRLKKYYHSNAESIKRYVDFSHSRMSKQLIDDLCNAVSAEEVLVLMANSRYHFYMDEKEYIYIEYYAENIRYNLAKRFMRFSSNAALVFMTYIILHQIEIMNLINIIEGIRYGMSEEQIRKTCIL